MTKVLTLSEFIRLIDLEKDSYVLALRLSPMGFPAREGKNAEFLQMRGYNYCLSRPFEPESITRLFAGWTLKSLIDWNKEALMVGGGCKYQFINGDNEIIIDTSDDEMSIQYICGNKWNICVDIPKTVEQFINDCHRYEIDLYLKEKT